MEQKTDLVEFNYLQEAVTSLVAPVMTFKVSDFHSAQKAIDLAKQVRELEKKVDAKRTELVAPLNERVKYVNGYAKDILRPLSDAEAYLKKEILAFEQEQERLRRIELAKVEAERRKREAELLAKQEEERRKQAEAAPIVEEVASLFGDDEEVSQAVTALEEVHLHEQAAMEQELRNKEADINSQRVSNVRKNLKVSVTDINKIPKEFLIVELNSQMALAAKRANPALEIPGVEFTYEASLAMGRNTKVGRAALR